MTDKATPSPASSESVMALYNEAEDAALDVAHELSGPQEMARLQNARDRLRAEVARLAAQAAPTEPSMDVRKSVDSVLRLVTELELAAMAAAHELAGPRDIARMNNIRDLLRAEVERLAQSVPTGPQIDPRFPAAHYGHDLLGLAAQAAPSEEMSPEFTDTARAALLWVLWHHQGGSSKVGQPIRFALGMGQHQPLSNYQVREAQRWEAMAPTRDAANVPPGEWNSEPEGLTPKQAWWAGYRVGKGLPPDMPRSEAVAAQPSQAPVVQAVQATSEPTDEAIDAALTKGQP